jgi:hypothetical protein
MTRVDAAGISGDTCKTVLRASVSSNATPEAKLDPRLLVLRAHRRTTTTLRVVALKYRIRIETQDAYLFRGIAFYERRRWRGFDSD